MIEIKQCVILCGGLGSRLGSITKFTPKSLITINGIPFLDLQLEKLAKMHVSEVVLCVGHFSDKIIHHVNTSKFINNLKLNIIISKEEKKLGTYGALKNAEKFLNKSFYLTYGDTYLNLNSTEFTNDLNNIFNLNNDTDHYILTFCIKPKRVLRGNVFIKDMQSFNQNPLIGYNKNLKFNQYIYEDYGFMVLNKNIFSLSQFNKVNDLSDVLNKLSNHNCLKGIFSSSHYFEIGSEIGISELEKFLSYND